MRAIGRWLLVLGLVLSLPGSPPAGAQGRDAGSGAELVARYAQFLDALSAYERRDYAAAFPVFLRLAREGWAIAQFYVGQMYYYGQGVSRNYAEALRWYRLAAEQGDADAQFYLGVMYVKGEGVPQDYAEAVRWFRLAAEQGHAGAQFNLGVMYHKGDGVPQDYAEALRWYRLAAEQGLSGAMNNLGVMYEFGSGVPRDPVRAHMWYNLAAARETDPEHRELAVRNRDRVAAGMSPGQLAEAQRLARAWRPGQSVAAPPPPAAPPPSGADRETVREVQRLLARLGFDPGPADGTVGARTRAAVRAYERSIGLPETGVVDARLLALLRAAAAGREARLPPPPAPPGSPILTDEDVDRLVKSGRAKIIRQGQSDPAAASAGEPSAADRVHLTGSGFWVSADGHVLTNRHVVEGCSRLTVRDARGDTYAAWLAAAARHDLALLDTDAEPAAVAVFREGSEDLLGEPVVTYGFPLSGLLASEGNLGTGTVAALAGPLDDATLLQITAPVQAGNSGGPVLDAKGRVVGVVVAKLDAVKVARATGDLPQNVNFAIKAPVAVRFLGAQGIDATVTAFGWDMPRAGLVDHAKAISVRIDCTR